MSDPILHLLDKIPHHLKFISQKHYDHAKHCRSSGKMQVLHRNKYETDNQGIYGVVGSWELRSLYRLYYVYMNEEGDYFCVRHDDFGERHIACRSSRRSFCKHIFFFLYDTWWKFTHNTVRYGTRMDYWIRRAIHKVPMFHYRQGKLTFETTLFDLREEWNRCSNGIDEWDENNDSAYDKPKTFVTRCQEDKLFVLQTHSDFNDPPDLIRIPVNKVQRGKRRTYNLKFEEESAKCFSCGKTKISIGFECTTCSVSYCEECRDLLNNGETNYQCLNPDSRGRAHDFL